MKKIYLLLFTSLFVARSFAGIITSTATGGNWSATTTWVGGVVPAAGDDVIIANGATVTIDASVNCTNLTVGQGTSGILQYNTTASARTLTVSGNMIINAGAIVRPGASGGFANILTIAGNLTNNGTLTTAITTNYINLVFNGTVISQTFANTGTITSNELRSLTINNTTGTVTIPSALSIASGATLTLTAGGLLVGAGGTGSITLGSAASGTFTCVRTNGSMVAATAAYGAGVTTKTYTYNGTGTITTGIELTAAASVTIDVLSINNSTLNVILNKAINVNSALTLTNGIVNTTATNLLSLGTATAAGILTGGSATAFINGPFARTFATRAQNALYNATTLFPVGKSGQYQPVYMAPTTAAAGVGLKAEAFITNTGTYTSPVLSLASDRWEMSVITGSANLTNLFIQLADAAINTNHILLKSTSAGGLYIQPGTPTLSATGSVTTISPITNAEFTGSGFFSYGAACLTATCEAPGGVSANMILWLKGDAGVSTSGATVTNWQDQRNINTFTTVGTPLLQNAASNYNPNILFDGNSVFNGNTNIVNATEAFAVAKIQNPTGVGSSGAVIGRTAAAPNDYFFHTEGGTFYNSQNNTYLYNTTIGNNIPTSVMNVDFSETPASSQKIRLNGLAYNNNGGDPNLITIIPTIGGRNGGTDKLQTGSEIAEVILYHASKASLAERDRITSYLALKYGITLSNAGGGAAGDYILSDNSLVWDASDNGSYHKQVIALVKDAASGLLQKQSRTMDDSLRLFVGSLAANNLSNTGSISIDKSALVMGNDGGGPQWSTSVTKPATINSRLTRTFKVTNTNFTNNFSIEIKCDTIGGLYSLGNLRFLVSATPDFSTATVYAAPDVTFAFGSIIVNGISNSLIPANTTRYVTVGLSLTILPVELTAFNATAVHNKEVVLNWKISTANNNPYFTVQKSADGKTWVNVTTVKGNADQTDFTVTDTDPFTSVSYYRLQQTTGNNEYRYSDIKKISLRVNVTLQVYPNPVLSQVVIEGTTTELSQLKFFTVTGQNVSGQIQVISRNNSKIVVDLSRLSKGIYMMKTNSTVTKLFKQ